MATVRDRQHQLAQSLRRDLGGDFVVVPAPDHPLVLRSVDILVGGRSGISAFMMASAEELRRPALLQTRLTLNQVALPPETRFVYVAARDESEPVLRTQFAQQLSAADRSMAKDAASFVETSGQASRSLFAEKPRQASQDRFASTYRLARMANEPGRISADLNVYGADDDARLAIDAIASVPSAFSGRPLSTRVLSGLAIRGADRWFDPGDDQPMPTGAPAGLVFAPDFPRPRHDPDKALRAAAFSGWILAPRFSTRPPEEWADLALRYARTR